MDRPPTAQRKCTVGIVGFGTVGQAVARILGSGLHPTLRLTHICNRNIDQKKVDWIGADVVWTESFDSLLESSVDVVVELIGGVSPARVWVERALACGKSVVTANKQLIAEAGQALQRQAEEAQQQLLFEAAVAGGIPILRGLRQGLGGDSIYRIEGILNGTCNYILTRMEGELVSFDDALAEAQELGYAEADPTADVEGYDAQSKLAILIGVGLGRAVRAHEIPLTPVTSLKAIDFVYARKLGCVVKQVARAELVPEVQGTRAAVQPALVPERSALGRVTGSQNIVVVDGHFGGETAFAGFGAGGEPTAVAVVSDLLALNRQGSQELERWLPVDGPPSPVVAEFEAPHYVRFIVADRPGVIANLAEIFSRHRINVDAVLQEPGWPKEKLPFVMTLESCVSSDVRAALGEISRLDFHVEPPLWLPVLAKREGHP